MKTSPIVSIGKRAKIKSVPIFLAILATAQGAWAQASNGTYTIVQELVSASGGTVGGGNPVRAQTVLGLPASGAASNGAYRLIGGLAPSVSSQSITATITVTGTVSEASAAVKVNGVPAAVSGTMFTADNIQLVLGPNTITVTATDVLSNTGSKSITVYLDLPAAKKVARFSIEVKGTINDASATVSVNGIAATIASGQFSALVPLVSGVNVLIATATDSVGNAGTDSITVFVPPVRPPAKPTVGTVGDPIPAVTTAASITIGGTKTPGTSIWINGSQVIGLSDATTWTATVTLVEGDNLLSVIAKDSSGTASAPATVNVILDNQAPIITASPPAKTNLNPLTIIGTVDDSLTQVTLNGITASRSARDFQAAVPLVVGANTGTITATSPNNYTATKSFTITLGTIPSIQGVQPPDGAKAYAGTATTIQISASDQEGDPIAYQVLVGGALLSDWGPSATRTWTPGAAASGPQTITVNVRDDYGGSSRKDLEVFVIRPPIPHP